MKNFKILFLLGLFFTSSVSLANPDYQTLPITGKKGGKIILSHQTNPKTFNPHLMDDVPTRQMLIDKVYIGLNRFNFETNRVENELAKSLEISEDGLTYTYKIRQGLKWSDGTPFTVDDVIFSWQALIHEKTISNIKQVFVSTKNELPQIYKVDNETVKFVLPELNVLFEDDLTNLNILPKHKWQKALDEGRFMTSLLANSTPEDIVTLAPYKLKKFVADQVMILERNPNYWKFDQKGERLPYLDRVVTVFTPDFETSIIKLQNGEVDLFRMRATDYDHVAKNTEKANLKVVDVGPSYNVIFYNFNLNPRKNAKGVPYVNPDKLKIFADKRFRQALNYATDRESLIKVAFLGRASPAYSIMSPASEWLPKDHKTYPYNLEKAKKLLDEMDLKDQDGDGFRDFPNGKPFSFSIITNVENKLRITIANVLKEEFSKVGIKANLKPEPFNSVITSISATSDYECVVLGWGSSVPPDPLGGKNIYFSHASMHVWNTQSPKPYYDFEKQMDEIIYKMLKTPKKEDRMALWQKFIEIWQEELPQTIVTTDNIYVAYNKKLENIKLSVLPPYHLWNVEEVYRK